MERLVAVRYNQSVMDVERMSHERGFRLAKLREVRRSRLLTQQALGAAAGVDRTTIIRIECGEFPAELRTIRQLAAALGVSPDQLQAAP